MKQFSIIFAFILLMALGVVLNEAALECETESKSNINGVKEEDKDGKETCGPLVMKCFKFKCEAGANKMKAKGCGTCLDLYFLMSRKGVPKYELDKAGCKCEEENAKNTDKPNPDNGKPKPADNGKSNEKVKSTDSESDNGSFGRMISIMAIGIGVFASFMLVLH